jgi:hypothetical protein
VKLDREIGRVSHKLARGCSTWWLIPRSRVRIKPLLGSDGKKPHLASLHPSSAWLDLCERYDNSSCYEKHSPAGSLYDRMMFMMNLIFSLGCQAWPLVWGAQCDKKILHLGLLEGSQVADEKVVGWTSTILYSLSQRLDSDTINFVRDLVELKHERWLDLNPWSG